MATRRIRDRGQPSTRVLTEGSRRPSGPEFVRQHTPRRIGDYDVLASLGQGGMGEVLLARRRGATEVDHRGLVAIKRLLPDLFGDADRVEMFIDEARICARLSHGNIAQVYELGEDAGSYFLAMEYVHGVAVKHVLAELEALPPPEVTAYTLGCVCAALHHAHTRTGDAGEPLRIIHRDVNPNNVMIGAGGQVKLIDFGVAKAADRIHHTLGATIKGSYAYMSPEQAAADPLDHRSDIFSAGTLLYVMLTGINPFVGNSVLQTLELVQQARVKPPSLEVAGVPSALERICLRALSRERERRYATAERMQHELEQYCGERGFAGHDLRAWILGEVPSLAAGGEVGGEPVSDELRDTLDEIERSVGRGDDGSDELTVERTAPQAAEALETLEEVPSARRARAAQAAPEPVTEELGTGDMIGPVSLRVGVHVAATRPLVRMPVPPPAASPEPTEPAGLTEPLPTEPSTRRWPLLLLTGTLVLVGVVGGWFLYSIAFAPLAGPAAVPGARSPAGASSGRSSPAPSPSAAGGVVPDATSATPIASAPDGGQGVIVDGALALPDARSYAGAPARSRSRRPKRRRVRRVKARSRARAPRGRPAADEAPGSKGKATQSKPPTKLGDRGATW